MKHIAILLALLNLVSPNVFSQNWINFNENNSGLNNNIVSGIVMDNNFNIWVGMTNGSGSGYGLNKFDGSIWTYYNTSNSGLALNTVSRVACDQNNNIWISYNSAGVLTYFDGSTWTTLNMNNSNIPSDYVADIFVDQNNVIWLACNGNTKFDGTNFINYFTPQGGPGYTITEIYVKDSIVFATSENLGLYKYNINNSSIFHYTTGNSNIPSMNFGTLEMDKNGILWLSCQYGFRGSTGGIATFDGTNFTAINPFVSSSTWVFYNQSIAIDTSNSVWVSSRCEGLHMFDGTTWNHMSQVLPQNGCAGFVYVDKLNYLWYGDVYSGLWTNSTSVGINNDLTIEASFLYPNPTNSKINFELQYNGLIQIFDTYGFLVMESNYLKLQSPILTLDISHFVSGLYILKAGELRLKFITD